ncbi:hypothetical protein BLNAU_7802 [Blattamonas nauphoetae]|uniref:Uncharacterized protein n=1 Tax=Blattamonas nauphoetae TaxID=2049346 RepID=A0ABQ9Y0D9_9EUKA|nr:hypothetical protein BLNAU_7802 [Blattamonas nauphoetae]
MPRSSFHPSFPMTPQTGLRYDVVFPVTPHVHIQRQRVHPQLHSSLLGELSYGTTPPRFHSRATETGLAGIVTAQSTHEFESPLQRQAIVDVFIKHLPESLSVTTLAHSSTKNTLREVYRNSFDQNGQTLDSSPIADLLLLLTPSTSTLVSIIAQRMLSRSPLVALYPYRPQAPYSHSHHVLNVADSVAFAPPSHTPLDVDITWVDVPVVLQRILIEEKTGEQLEQEGHGENIVETIESIIFANDSTAFNQALLDAIRIDDENTTLQVYIPIAGQSPSLSGFRPIASFAPVPLLEQQTITLTTPKAKKALSKPSSSPVFAASSLAPLQRVRVCQRQKLGSVCPSRHVADAWRLSSARIELPSRV